MIFKNTQYDILFNAPTVGRNWDIYVSQDGAPYILSITSFIQDNNDNSYTLEASSNDMNANLLNFKIVENNSPLYYGDEAIKFEISIITDDPIIYDTANYLNEIEADINYLKNILPGESAGTVVWVYTVYADTNYTTPLEGCLVKMTSDVDGLVDLKEEYSDVNGETKWLVSPGNTYYLWRQKNNWKFTNPDIQVIPSVAPFYSQTVLADSVNWTYTIYTDANYTTPLIDCYIKMTDDPEGLLNATEQYTDELGETIWSVIPGRTYYLWKSKTNWVFDNPDIQTIPFVGPFTAFDSFSNQTNYKDDIFKSMSTVTWIYTVYADPNFTTPLDGCLVKMTDDVDGLINLQEQYADELGKTTWDVVPGETYYMWKQKSNWRFDNPDIQIIPLEPPYYNITIIGENVSWKYIIYTDANYTTPLSDVYIKMTDDPEGLDNVVEKYTDEFGETNWSVIPGRTYYLWRGKDEWRFANPDVQIIPFVGPFSALSN
jgi:hypothetical protein